jgi:hypothetical protein
MCTEFVLILIYFFILSLVNSLLYRLLKSYFNKIFLFQKFKTIIKKSNKQNLNNFAFYYFFLKNMQKSENSLEKLNISYFPIEDIVLLGNFYDMISQKKKNFLQKSYFIDLLKIQSLPISLNNKK